MTPDSDPEYSQADETKRIEIQGELVDEWTITKANRDMYPVDQPGEYRLVRVDSTPETVVPEVTLPSSEWRRVLMGLAVYANRVEGNGDESHADELRTLGREVALQLEEADCDV